MLNNHDFGAIAFQQKLLKLEEFLLAFEFFFKTKKFWVSYSLNRMERLLN